MKYTIFALLLLGLIACKEEEVVEEVVPCHMQAESDLVDPVSCLAGSYTVQIREYFNSDSTGALPPQERTDVIFVSSSQEGIRIDGKDLKRRTGQYWEFYNFGINSTSEASFDPRTDSIFFQILRAHPTYSVRYEYVGKKQ